MQKGILRRFTSFITLCLVLAIGTNAQTVPTTGFYYITAQTWNGTKYVERFLYLNGNNVYQTLDVAQASQWAASNPQNGSGIALSTGGKYLMRGGITSTNWGSIVAEPTVTTSEPPQGSLTIKSTVTNYQSYVIAPNAGTVFTSVNAPNEDSYQPKTSLYTPYFKFYKSNFPVVCVVEKLSDGTPKELGATYMLIRDGHPEPGNAWYIRPNCYITIDNESYNKEIYTFEGFRVGASDELVKTISTNTFTSDKTTVTAVFTSKDFTGEKFTFISSFPEWYKNQQKYKAIYLDTTDNKLKWKDYDPQDDAFYFVAHGSLDNLTLESLAKPGYYITKATDAVATTGNRVELRPLSEGDYNIVAGNSIFATYNANNGRNASGTLANQSSNNGSGTIASWWVQSANDKNAEDERYQQALEGERHKKARAELLQAINSVVVGDNMGNVPLSAYELAVNTYENTSLGADDYTHAITILYSACNVPPVGSKWRIINNENNNQLITIGINDGLYSKSRLNSLHQIWEVESMFVEETVESDSEETEQTQLSNSTILAFRNLGSGTYLSCNTMSSDEPTITTDVRSYLNLNSDSPGVFSLEVINRADQNIYLSPSNNDNAYAIIVNDSGLWRFEEVTENELAQLSQEEVTRQAKRQELLELIEGAKTLSTTAGGIGYYTNLATPITNAQTKYADASSLTSEYLSAITTLENAIRSTQNIQPNSEATYIICDPEGRIAMRYADNASTMDTFVDTNVNFFWKLTPVTRTDSNVLPWNQQYTLTSIDGNNTVLNVTLQLIGNDEYYITIDGDQAWNSANAQNPLSIHKASHSIDHSYLTDGETYRIRNVANNKVLTRSEIWTSRVSVETADNTLTDYNQIWRIEKQPGADRYTFQDCEVNRYIEEQMKVGSQLEAAFNPGIWHLQSTGQDGQFQILTTMAPMDQLAVAYNGDKAVAAAQNAAGTAWVFEKVTPIEKPDPNHQVYKILNRNKANDYIYTYGNPVGHTGSSYGSNFNNDYYTKWILIERDSISADGTKVLDSNGNQIHLVAIQSGYNSKYIIPVTPATSGASPFAMNSVPYWFHQVEYTNAATGITYLMFKNPRANQYLAVNKDKDQLAWATDKTSTIAHWTLVEMEGLIVNEEEVIDRQDSMYGFCKPEDGSVVRITTSVETGVEEYTCLEEYYKTNILQHKAMNDKRYAQLWRLHQNPETGFFKFENIYTGNYIAKPTSATNALTTTEDESKAGEFAIVQNKNITSKRMYNILDPTLGLGLSAASGNITTNGTPTDKDQATTSEFRFLTARDKDNVPYTEEDYAAMRQKFIENRDIMNYVSKYDATLQTLFTDRAYSELKPELTEEEIEEALENLPEILVDMVNKIRNDEWPTYNSGTNWDQMFRIREYPVISHPNFSSKLNCTFHFSHLNEPMGIMAHPGDVLAIMVSDAPKSGCTLSLQTAQGFARYANGSYPLKQGLNFIQITDECYLFLNYVINSTNDHPSNYLSNFPDIKVHIEGGEIYGCINRVHGPGDGTAQNANALWQKMIGDGLIKNAPMTQVAGESVIFNFNSWDMVQSCPVHIGDVIDLWDSWVKIQQWVVGMRDRDGKVIGDYIPNLDKRFNSKWGAYERSGGYMDANGGGTEYESSTIRNIINYESLKNGGGSWGPAHEFGHQHQPAITMCGMTEVSNNLFSNVNSREFGAIVSRGISLPDAASVFARGGNWFDNNIWVQTQMYYKLYLYYHVAGNDPTFYPRVFQKLRQSGFMRNPSVAVPADQDYLKFAKVCSEVAGEDLSEFFEAYGMLRPLTPENSLKGASSFSEWKGQYCRTVGDYSTYHVYTTDKMIADAKAFMQAQGPKNGNIMFIDDRIRQEQAAFPGAKPGQMRAGRGDGGTIGAFGNVGMWDEFTPESHMTYAKNYTMTKEWGANGITVHISGNGAVGYKVYGPEGELVYFSAFNNFQIPAVIFNKYDFNQLAIVAAQADGTSVEITTAEDAKFRVTTYRDGNSEGITTTSTGLFNPELRANDVCVVEPVADLTLDGFRHPETANVILKGETESTMQLLSLQDLTNFYIPEDVDVVETALYQRPNTMGWNSLCLPVAVTEDDFGPDTKIYTVKSVEEEGEKIIYLIRKPSVEAGEPCFVLCGDESSDWDLSITGSKAAAEIQPATSKDGSVQINGSYSSQTIGAGKYKLSGDGTKFGITKADTSTVAAFRSYIETPVSGPTVFRVRLIENPTGIDDPVIDRVMENGKIYDLSGRQIPAPLQGQPYILNGKVCYNR